MSVSDEELADMEARLNGACSLCGAQAGVNIDCGLCEELDREERLIAALRAERIRSNELEGIAGEAGRLSAEVDEQTEHITQLEAELAEATRPFAQQRENWLSEIRRQKEKKASAYNRIAELEAEREELRAEVERLRRMELFLSRKSCALCHLVSGKEFRLRSEDKSMIGVVCRKCTEAKP